MSSRRRLRRKCERKIAYLTRAEAIEAVKRLRVKGRDSLHIYRCKWCGHFHLGHHPAFVRRIIDGREEANG